MTRTALIQLRRGTQVQWVAANPILEAGEPAFEIDTFRLKIGDGTTVYTSLPYLSSGTSTNMVSNPLISPSSRLFTGSLIVTMVCDTQDAEIHYTTDGSDPTILSTLYNPLIQLTLTDTTVVKAKAFKSGLDASTEVSKTYTYTENPPVETPVISPGSTFFNTSQLITITCATEDAVIYYTTTGATPTAASNRYGPDPFTITTDTTIKAIAIKPMYFDSVVTEPVYFGKIGTNLITFHHTGQTFQPLIKITGSPIIRWAYADSTTSNSATPSIKDFGSAAGRDTTLKVYPWNSVTQINLGYSGEDGGEGYNTPSGGGYRGMTIEVLPQQNVTTITGLSFTRNSLIKFAACFNPITALDVSNFTALEVVECLMCTTLSTLNTSGTTSLRRLCVEGCGFSNLDLSACTYLEDLRASAQHLSTGTHFTLNYGNIGQHLWHMCTHTNPLVTTINFANFPGLYECWIYGTLLNLSLTNMSPSLRSLLVMYDTITAVDLSPCVNLHELSFAYTNASTAIVDAVLAQMDGLNITVPQGQLYWINLVGCSAPSSQVHITNLQSRGWQVYF